MWAENLEMCIWVKLVLPATVRLFMVYAYQGGSPVTVILSRALRRKLRAVLRYLLDFYKRAMRPLPSLRRLIEVDVCCSGKARSSR